MLLVSCATQRPGQRAAGPDVRVAEAEARVAGMEVGTAGVVIQEGMASWYGPGFHGRATANGETYDMNRLTAAHRTLPFESIVRVLNNENGNSVVVRINDRGPYVGDRVIDLSREAARRIDMINAGTARVTLELLSSPVPVTRRGADLNRETFTVQLESYLRRADAERRVGEIPGSRVAEARVDGRIFYRVYYGRYQNRSDAEQALRDLRRRGLDGFVKQEEN